MKFWEKLFIYMMIIFQIFFVSSSIFLINKSFKLNLSQEINSGINEESRLCSLLTINMQLVRSQKAINITNPGFTKNNADHTIKTTLSDMDNHNIFVNITDYNGTIIYNNFFNNIAVTKEDMKKSLNTTTYVIKDINDKSYLFINENIELGGYKYRISYIKNVTSIFQNEKSMFNLLIRLNLFVSALLAIVMIIVSKIIVRPINKLIKSTQNISQGNFNVRVNVNSEGEVGMLAENFNNMAEVIEEKIIDLKNASEDKQRFIDNMAHEIRTPLTSIIGYADFLKNNKCDEKTTQECVQYIYSEGKKLQIMSTKLMDLITLKKQSLEIKNINVKSLLNDISKSLTPKLNEKAINLKIISQDFNIIADKDLIIILISNLIDNAIKASKNGDEIVLRGYEDKYPVIQVEDNGIGMREEDIKKIFEPFYMVDKARDRRNNGAGLGLSICAQIAELHNAEIQVDSQLGKGTTIKVLFSAKA